MNYLDKLLLTMAMEFNPLDPYCAESGPTQAGEGARSIIVSMTTMAPNTWGR